METFEAYRALPGVNWSALKLYHRSPAHYLHHLDHPAATTPACLLGRAVHALTLEGEAAYQERFAVAPEGLDRRTKAGKEAWSEFEQEAKGRDILTPEQHHAVVGMAASVLAHAKARRLLDRCTSREATVLWTDDPTGLDCKARLDALSEREGLVVDLKTCQDATAEAFSRAALKYHYHGQAAYYLAGLQAAGITARFLFIGVEVSQPHGVAVFLADDDFLAAGRSLVRSCLDLHAACLTTNTWPGYPDSIQTLTLPPWARMAA